MFIQFAKKNAGFDLSFFSDPRIFRDGLWVSTFTTEYSQTKITPQHPYFQGIKLDVRMYVPGDSMYIQCDLFIPDRWRSPTTFPKGSRFHHPFKRAQRIARYGIISMDFF